VADHSDRLARVEERADEPDRGRVGAQLVGVGDTARQDEAVVFGRVGLGEDPVGLEGVPPVEVVEGLDRFVRRSDQVGLPLGLADRLRGSTSSTCSTPSLATRNAILLPLSFSDM
jgi:hypothetical protein